MFNYFVSIFEDQSNFVTFGLVSNFQMEIFASGYLKSSTNLLTVAAVSAK